MNPDCHPRLPINPPRRREPALRPDMAQSLMCPLRIVEVQVQYLHRNIAAARKIQSWLVLSKKPFISASSRTAHVWSSAPASETPCGCSWLWTTPPSGTPPASTPAVPRPPRPRPRLRSRLLPLPLPLPSPLEVSAATKSQEGEGGGFGRIRRFKISDCWQH